MQIPAETTEDALRAVFSPFGTIADVIILRDATTGVGKGCGFVKFGTRAEAVAAIGGLHGRVRTPRGVCVCVCVGGAD